MFTSFRIKLFIKMRCFKLNHKYFCPYKRYCSNLTPREQKLPHIITAKPNNCKSLTSDSVRQSFIDYFVLNHDHTFIKSSSVLPMNDPSLFFVNAGMNQFKPIFLNSNPDGNLLPQRVVNSQKCIRVGGKHCDLDSVGRDFSHHTFFEMLGNWSFGDYHKSLACEMAWKCLTEVFGLDASRLMVTYFGGDKTLGLNADLETRDIWRQIGVPESRIIPLGSKDNLWEMGETGPCGVCTEIHYMLDAVSTPINQENMLALLSNCVEIWNLVFIQYNRKANGELEPLGSHFVDTGMGLERLLAILQGVNTSYQTDLFLPFFSEIEKTCGSKPYSNQLNDPVDIGYRILADHIRMITIAASDGLKPGFEEAPWILRRIIRRASLTAHNVFHTHETSIDLLCNLARIAAHSLGNAYPEIHNNFDAVIQAITDEVREFECGIKRTQELPNELKLLEQEFESHYFRTDSVLDTSFDLKTLTAFKSKAYSMKHSLCHQVYLEDSRGKLLKDVEQFSHRLDLFENEINAKLDDLTQELKKSFQSALIELDGNGKSSAFLVHLIENNSDIKTVLKICLDIVGHKPIALFIQQTHLNHLYIYLSVPQVYSNQVNALQWFNHISDHLTNKTFMNDKKLHKVMFVRSDSLDNKLLNDLMKKTKDYVDKLCL